MGTTTKKARNSSNRTATATLIEPGVLYHLEEFKRRMGWSIGAMRTARKNGLKVRSLGGRRYVHADDFFAYLEKIDTDSGD